MRDTGFPALKTLEAYDFAFATGAPRSQIQRQSSAGRTDALSMGASRVTEQSEILGEVKRDVPATHRNGRASRAAKIAHKARRAGAIIEQRDSCIGQRLVQVLRQKSLRSQSPTIPRS